MGAERRPPETQLDALAFRYSNYDTPFWARRNTRPGRWHLPEDGPTQYLSLSTDGAWADLIRWEGLRTPEELGWVQMQLWQVRVADAGIADYGGFERAEAAGFAPDALVDDDHAACQAEGRRLRELGYRGVLCPSAALPDAVSLTLFGPRVATRWDRRALLASAIPSSVLVEGAPPAELLDRVRHRGAGHAGLADHHRMRRRGR